MLNSQVANIKPFDGNSFSNWEFRLKLVLEQNGILNVLEETLPTDLNLQVEFNKKDAKARNIIVQWLTDSVLEIVRDKKTAREMLETLRSTYTRKGLSIQVDLQRKLRNMKFNKGSLADFISEFDKTVADLKASGGNMEESEQITQLLAAMPDSYQAVTTSIDVLFSTNPTNVSVQFVKNKLLQEEIRQGNNNQESGSDSVAFTSSSRGSFRGRSRGKGRFMSNFRFKCFKCGKPGHKRNECKESTHVADCSTEKEEEEVTFVADVVSAMSVTEKGMNNNLITFIVDSGTTNHLINKEAASYLSEVKPVNYSINVAKKDSVVKVYKSGNLYVENEAGRKFKIKDVLQSDDLQYNLLSVKRIEKEGFKIIFEKGKVKICNKDCLEFCV